MGIVRRPAICFSVSNASLSDVASLAAKVGSDMAVFYHASMAQPSVTTTRKHRVP
jgi:hypothetical protein